jgi:hypothetical protein
MLRSSVLLPDRLLFDSTPKSTSRLTIGRCAQIVPRAARERATAADNDCGRPIVKKTDMRFGGGRTGVALQSDRRMLVYRRIADAGPLCLVVVDALRAAGRRTVDRVTFLRPEPLQRTALGA